MQIKTLTFSVNSKGHTDIIDLTDEVQSRLKESGLRNGNVLVFAPGATAGITTIEYEPGLLKDYPNFFERIIPSNIKYSHDETWHDANGYAHVRASLQGASITIPFADSKLLLGTWQQIVLIDFDNRQRTRRIITQFIGE